MTDEAESDLADRLRPILAASAGRHATLSYLDLAQAAGVRPPRAIHRVTLALERLMREDHAEGRPLLAAVAVSAKRGGTPAPGFFRLAAELGVYFGPERGPQAALFHTLELDRVCAAFGAEGASHD